MRRWICLCWIAVVISFAFPGLLRAQGSPPGTILFTNVNVVPMDRERILMRQSVLVRDGRIVSIAGRMAAPANSRVIDGAGAFLVPGLADMHVHVDRSDLPVMLAYGITTALHMGEARNSFVGRARQLVAAGQVAGPRVFAALVVDGSSASGHLVVPDAEAARATVRVARANGYEFIKVYNDLAPATFAALVSAGREAGIPIIGHSVDSMGLEQQLSGGQIMVAHLEEFLYAFFRIPEGEAIPPDSEITRAIEFLRAHGTTVTADLATFETIARQWGRPEVLQSFLRLPEYRYVSPFNRAGWRNSGYQRNRGNLDARARFLARFAKALADADIPLIAGTDSPSIPGLVAGDALHLNLAALVAAGFSRFQALATATREAGAFVGRAHPETDRFGVIAPGARADLLLVRGDPLTDLRVLRRPLGVMVNGRWHDAAALNAMLEDAAAAYSATP